MTKNNVLLLAALTSIIHPTTSFAQDEPESRAQYTVGVRVWNASWSTAMPTLYAGNTPLGGGAVAESLDSVDGKRDTSVSPTLSMRKDRLVVSASYARYSSNFYVANTVVPTLAPLPSGPTVINLVTSRSDHVVRKESDVTAGYAVAPNIIVSLGFKYATEDRDSTYDTLHTGPVPLLDNTIRALLLGVSAAFPIQGGLSFTGQFAYGPARAKTHLLGGNSPALPVAFPETVKNNSRYQIMEVGVNYALGISNAYFRGASIGLGYRSQLARTKGMGPSQSFRRTYRDEREGIVASLNVAI